MVRLLKQRLHSLLVCLSGSRCWQQAHTVVHNFRKISKVQFSMFSSFYWLFLGWKTGHKGVNAITREATPLSVLSAAGTIPLSLDGTEPTPALSGKGEFPICVASHLSLTPVSCSGNSLLPPDPGGWQILGFVLSLPPALPDPGSSPGSTGMDGMGASLGTEPRTTRGCSTSRAMQGLEVIVH